MHFPYWAEESRALEHIVGRHVTVSQLLSNRGSMSTTELSWGQSAKAAGPPIWGRGLGALAGQALFTPAAGPGVFAASITLPPGRQGGNFCTSQNRICPQKVSRLRFVHCIQELVARKVCWFDGNRFVCVSCNQVGYWALTTAWAVHLYASGQLRPWPYYTLSAADTPLNLLQHDRGHRQPKLEPSMIGNFLAADALHISEYWCGARLSRAAVRWAYAELVAQHIGGAQNWVKEYCTPSVHECLLPSERETMTESDDWIEPDSYLAFCNAIVRIREEPHLSHNNILNALGCEVRTVVHAVTIIVLFWINKNIKYRQQWRFWFFYLIIYQCQHLGLLKLKSKHC